MVASCLQFAHIINIVYHVIPSSVLRFLCFPAVVLSERLSREFNLFGGGQCISCLYGSVCSSNKSLNDVIIRHRKYDRKVLDLKKKKAVSCL